MDRRLVELAGGQAWLALVIRPSVRFDGWFVGYQVRWEADKRLSPLTWFTPHYGVRSQAELLVTALTDHLRGRWPDGSSLLDDPRLEEEIRAVYRWHYLQLDGKTTPPRPPNMLRMDPVDAWQGARWTVD